MKRLLKIAGGLLGTLALILFGLVAFPDILNPVLEPALQRLLGQVGVKVESGAIRAELQRQDWRSVRLTLEFDQVTAGFPSGKAEKLSGGTAVLWTFPTEVRWLTIDALAQNLELDFTPEEEQAGESSSETFVPLPESGELSLPRFAIVYEDQRFEGQLQAAFEPNSQAQIGVTGALVSEEETNSIAATFIGNPVEFRGQLNARVEYGENQAQVRNDGEIWDAQVKGPWGSLNLAGPGIEKFEGHAKISDQSLTFENCRAGPTGGQCLVTFEQNSQVLVTAEEKSQEWEISLSPERLPKWVRSHGKNYTLNILPSPLRLRLNPISPPLVIEWEKFIAAMPERFQVIPRPFNVLSGTLSVTTQEPLIYTPQELQTRGLVRMQLQSEGQVVDADIQVKHDKGGVRIQVQPNKIRLVAPPVDVIRSARFVPEDRLRGPATTESKPLDLKWSLKATNGYPLSIELPERGDVISLQGELSSSPLKGWVAVRPTRLELLNKEMRIRRFRASPLPTGEWKLSSRITTEFRGYEILIDLGGTSENTQISLSSSPPLTEREIVGLLLFGKLTTALSPTEKNTTEDFQAAAMDGAFNLLSLYFLSSTPIRALSYNPVSGRVGISLALSESSSLTLETETGQNNSVEWQKRLGGNWWFTTKLYSEDGVDPSEGQTFLEWIKQYE